MVVDLSTQLDGRFVYVWRFVYVCASALCMMSDRSRKNCFPELFFAVKKTEEESTRLENSKNKDKAIQD